MAKMNGRFASTDGYSKRRTWRKVHLALNADTGPVHAALMTHQNVADGDALAKFGSSRFHAKNKSTSSAVMVAYDTQPCHAAIAARSAIPF
ncbi:MAG: transposase [Burkholderia sp.]